MAVDMFLYIEGPNIAGESQSGTKAHPTDCIDVLAWAWGESQSGTTHMGGGGGAGKASFQDLSVTGWYEKSTHQLMNSCSIGEHHDKITLTCRKAAKEALEYIVLEMEDCIITSVSIGGSGGEDRLTVNFTINFSKFSIAYTPQNDQGGKEAVIEHKFDIAQNLPM